MKNFFGKYWISIVVAVVCIFLIGLYITVIDHPKNKTNNVHREITVVLKADEKVLSVDVEKGQIWVLTRPMEYTEKPETYRLYNLLSPTYSQILLEETKTVLIAN
jgi:hypothetical protein